MLQLYIKNINMWRNTVILMLIILISGMNWVLETCIRNNFGNMLISIIVLHTVNKYLRYFVSLCNKYLEYDLIGNETFPRTYF